MLSRSISSLRSRLGGGALLLALLLAGCTSAPESRRLLESRPADLPPRVELTGTPFFPQREYQCGPASLATLLTANGITVTPDELVSEIYIPARRGSLQAEIVAAARDRGRLVFTITPTLTTLLQEIAAGRPVLVLQNLGLDSLPQWHYAVVIGYDLGTGEVVLRSGENRRLITTLPLFEQSWRRAEHWAIITPGDGMLPITIEPLPLLRQIGGQAELNPRSARAAYRAVTRRWPGEASGWLLLGNADYQSGEYQAATTAFRRAVVLEPGRVAAWNNLAYAEAASGCGRNAGIALDCALRLAPEDPNTLSSSRELQPLLGSDRTGCERLECFLPMAP